MGSHGGARACGLTTSDVLIVGAQLDIQLRYHPMTSSYVSSCP